MVDAEAAVRRALETCENKHEVMIVICGFLLGMLAEISDEPNTAEEPDPNKWAHRLVAEMRRVDAIPNRPDPLTRWFQLAGHTLVEMRRIHGLTSPS